MDPSRQTVEGEACEERRHKSQISTYTSKEKNLLPKVTPEYLLCEQEHTSSWVGAPTAEYIPRPTPPSHRLRFHRGALYADSNRPRSGAQRPLSSSEVSLFRSFFTWCNITHTITLRLPSLHRKVLIKTLRVVTYKSCPATLKSFERLGSLIYTEIMTSAVSRITLVVESMPTLRPQPPAAYPM